MVNASEFNQINTTLSVKERTFLSKEQLNQLLHARDNEMVALQLSATDYRLDAQDLADTALIEEALMQSLIREYQFAFNESPSSDIVEIFALKYMYHNLKVLLKMRATQRDLKDLLIPIGRYSLEQLEHLVLTLESESCEPIVIEEVQRTWHEYLDYQHTDAIDAGMDSAYFRHLRYLAEQVDEESVSRVIDAMIDFFNATTVKRALEQHKPKSFMYQLMSRKGTHTPKEMLILAKEDRMATWFERLNPFTFEHEFDTFVEKMQQGTIRSTELEQLQDAFVHRLLKEAKFEGSGCLPILRYIYGKELEVKNLRLILTGRANQLELNHITERMRPVYGN